MMGHEKERMASAKNEDPGTAAYDTIIAAALADRVLPLPDAADVDAAVSALTPADREALALRETPNEFVRRILAAIESREPSAPTATGDESTHLTEDDMTIPDPGSRFAPDHTAPALGELMWRLDEVQAMKEIHWPSCYRKLDELGRGGQGIVYLTECLDELRGKQALKVYSPQPYDSVGAYHEDMQRLLSVAELVHRIHHDNLVGVQRFVDDKGIYVMVMQWIDGFDLRRLLDIHLFEQLRISVTRGRWDDLYRVIYAPPVSGRLCLQPLQAVNIVEKCLNGLNALHQKGIVHGDIKPANIMLDSNGSIRLIDIGSAYLFKSPPRQRTWSPRYAPPEFLERGEWTPQSDLASLGYVLIELLSGDANLGGPSMSNQSTRTTDRHRDDELLDAKRQLPDRLHELLPAHLRVCEKLMRLCRKLIDPDPKKRFADAEHAIDKHPDGAWYFRIQLARDDLVVREATVIKEWIDDFKKVVA
jgi:serine/threonine-protein kinase